MESLEEFRAKQAQKGFSSMAWEATALSRIERNIISTQVVVVVVGGGK